MSSKFEKEKQKQIQERCQRLLTEMLKDEDNKYCVDCDAKGPRWASWNIGIFLCIRCAGIHRNLGVHISKVKSVNLDSWTPQQIVSLQQMGNSRARAVYEANLPDNFRRPQTDSSLESFIRAKYEHKKYIAREWVQPSLPKVNWDKEIEEEMEKQKKKKRDSKHAISSSRSLSTPPVIPNPLPKPQPNTSPKVSHTVASVDATPHYTDLLGLDTPTKESPSGSKKTASDSDLFSGFLSSSIETNNAVENSVSSTTTSVSNGTNNSNVRTDEEENFFNQSALSTPNKQKPLTKDSILALYGNPGVYASPMAPSVSQSYNTQLISGTPVGFPNQLNIQAGFQNGLVQQGNQFPGMQQHVNNTFASNPFYNSPLPVNMAFSTQKTSSTTTLPVDSTNVDNKSQLSQQMASLNLNMSNTSFPPVGQQSNPVFPSSSPFLANTPQVQPVFGHQQSSGAFGHTLAANTQWQ